jgi:hypothetical protein
MKISGHGFWVNRSMHIVSFFFPCALRPSPLSVTMSGLLIAAGKCRNKFPLIVKSISRLETANNKKQTKNASVVSLRYIPTHCVFHVLPPQRKLFSRCACMHLKCAHISHIKIHNYIIGISTMKAFFFFLRFARVRVFFFSCVVFVC